MATSPYYLNSGMRCVKYMLLTINFMFALTAILLILIGTTIQAVFFDFRQFIYDYFLSPPALLIAVGCIMLIVAIFGCFGAMRESTLLINIYGVFLVLVCILEIAAAIAAFLLQGQISSMLHRTMMISLHSYEDVPFAREGVDFMQTALQCCGVDRPEDWSGHLHRKYTDYPQTDQIIVPRSCCSDFSYTESDKCLDYHKMGCLNRMEFVVGQSAMFIATGATAVAFVQILGALCAFMLAKTIRRNKSIRAARQWQLQQSLGIIGQDKNNFQESGYTQLHKSEPLSEPITYTANSPSVN